MMYGKLDKSFDMTATKNTLQYLSIATVLTYLHTVLTRMHIIL